VHEDIWKRSASDTAKERLGIASEAWCRPESFVDALSAVFTRAKRLVLTDQFSGIAWNSDKAALVRDKSASRTLTEATRMLLYASDPLAIRLRGVAQVREDLRLRTSL